MAQRNQPLSEKQAGAPTHERFTFARQDANLILAYLVFSFVALLMGAVAGLLQGLDRGGYIELSPNVYYLLLTLHGVALALVFTTFFIVGFLYSGVVKTLGGTMRQGERSLGWTAFCLMLAGTLMALVTILNNSSSVLYTFYAPMQASPWFYVGLGLVILGSWVSAIPIFTAYARWRKEHKNRTSPLFAYMSVATMILWIIATLGVVIEVVLQLIPWAFGWAGTINVSLSRTLFWYFGHPLVYFWLLPAYIYWYVNIPQIIKGRLFSDSLPRLTFVLFILYSIPVGFHHQLTEPGISPIWKFVQVILTMTVVIPSLMTVFALLATFELAGRAKGATGRFGWLKTLPWKDVRFFAPFLAMVTFIPAGAGGIVNASYQMNQVVHNTLWVTGHFHMTLAASVVLTFFGISYWLVPLLTKRTLTPLANSLGIVQSIIWTVGILLLGGTMHLAGLLGSPRRTSFSTYNDHPAALDWLPYMKVVGAGGVFLFVGIMLYLAIIVYLLFFAPKSDVPMEYPIGQVNENAQQPPRILERWSVWIAITFALILIAYLVPIMDLIQNAPPGSPPIRSW
jgi:cytochrome c oxidase subunit 1